VVGGRILYGTDYDGESSASAVADALVHQAVDGDFGAGIFCGAGHVGDCGLSGVPDCQAAADQQRNQLAELSRSPDAVQFR